MPLAARVCGSLPQRANSRPRESGRLTRVVGIARVVAAVEVISSRADIRVVVGAAAAQCRAATPRRLPCLGSLGSPSCVRQLCWEEHSFEVAATAWVIRRKVDTTARGEGQTRVQLPAPLPLCSPPLVADDLAARVTYGSYGS